MPHLTLHRLKDLLAQRGILVSHDTPDDIGAMRLHPSAASASERRKSSVLRNIHIVQRLLKTIRTKSTHRLIAVAILKLERAGQARRAKRSPD